MECWMLLRILILCRESRSSIQIWRRVSWTLSRYSVALAHLQVSGCSDVCVWLHCLVSIDFFYDIYVLLALKFLGEWFTLAFWYGSWSVLAWDCIHPCGYLVSSGSAPIFLKHSGYCLKRDSFDIWLCRIGLWGVFIWHISDGLLHRLQCVSQLSLISFNWRKDSSPSKGVSSVSVTRNWAWVVSGPWRIAVVKCQIWRNSDPPYVFILSLE